MPTSLFRYRSWWRVLAVIALLAATGWWLVSPEAPRARANGTPIIHWDQSMIYASLNYGYPEGPVGEPATVHGANFTPGQKLKLMVVGGDSNRNSSLCTATDSREVTSVGMATADASGSFTASFAWPLLTYNTVYGQTSICSFDASTNQLVSSMDDGPFTILSDSAPTFSLSASSVAAGSTVTVTGKGWVPAQALNITIAACADCDPGSSNIASAATTSVGNYSGTFSINVVIPTTMAANNYVVNVTSQNGPLDASHINGLGTRQLTVTAGAPVATATATTTATAVATVTATATATVAATATTTATTTSTTHSGNNSSSASGGGDRGLIIGLLVVVVLLLGAAGAIFVFLARRSAGPTNAGLAGDNNDPRQGSGGGYEQGQAGPFGASSPNQGMFPGQAPFTPFPQGPMGSSPQQGFNQQGYARQSAPSWPGQQPWQSQAGGPQSQPGNYSGFPQSQQQARRCQRCGNSLNAGNLVCGNCGLRNFSGGYNDPTIAY